MTQSIASLRLPITMDLLIKNNSVGSLGGPSALGGLSGSRESRGTGGPSGPRSLYGLRGPNIWLVSEYPILLEVSS